MKTQKTILLLLISIILLSCSSEEKMIHQTPSNKTDSLKILALGDSYTIGQSVCSTCKFPEQLKDSLIVNLLDSYRISLQVIAQTGWTTTNLIAAINSQNPTSDFDLVTLLVGVNNQYQNKPFSLYETEFPQLVTKAISFAKGNQSKVIVVSIPDYAYTPFGQGSNNAQNISTQIDQYNLFAKNYCDSNNIDFVNITDITRLGLQQTNLVANDGLHPSQIAYSKFVERILPLALEKIE
jgi:lysophospholipase L1-like esterase